MNKKENLIVALIFFNLSIEEKKMQLQNSIIKELYAIRFGLSTVYTRVEKIQNNNEKIESINKKTSKLISEKNNYLENAEAEIYEKVNSKYPYSAYHNGKKNPIISLLMYITTLASLGVGVYMSIQYFKKNWFGYEWRENEHFIPNTIVWLIYVAIGVAIGLIIGFVGYSISYYIFKNLNDNVSNKLKVSNEIKVNKKRKEAISKLLSSTTYISKIETYDERKRNEVFKVEQKKDSLISENKALEIEIAAIEKGMSENYTSIIKSIDWKHIDLLIYYFETGRVDTMKEALILLEQQIMTNQITRSIEIGYKQISENIQAFGKMISSRLSGIENQISNMSSDMESLYGGVQSLTTNVEMLQRQNQYIYQDIKATQYITSSKLAQTFEDAKNHTYKVRIE